MCMVNPTSRKVDSSTRGVARMTSTIRPTSRPSAANQRPIAPISVPITSQPSSHKTTLTTIPRHPRHPRHPRDCPAPTHRSGEPRVCPGPSRPGKSRIHSIDVVAEPPAAFHAYSYLSPIGTNEKGDKFDKIDLKDAIGYELAHTKCKEDCKPFSHVATHLPRPVTSGQSSDSTKSRGSVARARARLILILALTILCIYNYSHYYRPLR
ncbi:unnamed protein product [Debaryomyces fabryi]|nr:unnamed protein product [Debaryomyces fabryi]